MIEHVTHWNSTALEAGGHEGGERLGKMERIYLVESQLAVLQIIKQSSICTAARTERFEGNCIATMPAQMAKKKAGYNRFADSGIGAGNEDDTEAHFPDPFYHASDQ